MQCAKKFFLKESWGFVMTFLWLCGNSLGEGWEVPINHLVCLQHLGCDHISLTICLKKLVRRHSRIYIPCWLPCCGQQRGNRRSGCCRVFPEAASQGRSRAFSWYQSSLSLGIITGQKKKYPLWWATFLLLFFLYLKLLQKVQYWYS